MIDCGGSPRHCCAAIDGYLDLDKFRHIFQIKQPCNYIKMFCNSRRRHGLNDQLSPLEHEAQYQKTVGERLTNWERLRLQPLNYRQCPVPSAQCPVPSAQCPVPSAVSNWRARRDSNPRPSGSKPDALSS